MKTFILMVLLLALCCLAQAEEREQAISLYAAQMTGNHWDDFFRGQEVQNKDSTLVALAWSKRLGGHGELISYEVEGQLAKHFGQQEHLELNALVSLRWEKFFWDRWLDTSAAFGLGPSYATEKPRVEIENDGDTAKFMLYWMLELAVVPWRGAPEYELLTRIHHRSNAYGLMADEGGSNALAIGVRYRF